MTKILPFITALKTRPAFPIKANIPLGKPSKQVKLKQSGAQLLRRLLLGFFLSSGISGLAYRRRSLSSSGAAAAIPVGTATLGFGGTSWALTLIFFFASSSFLSHFHAREKAHTALDKFSKGSQRDLGQVIANGGSATVLAIAYGIAKSPKLREILMHGYIGALATANADTWATETGTLSTRPPHLITNGQIVEPGTSGGITWLGTIASATGATAIGTVFQRVQRNVSPGLPLIALCSGLAGSLFDSLLGATVQAMYYCPTCQKETERHVHSCGTPTRHIRGLRWLDNDIVNTLATVFGSIIAMLLPRLFNRRKRVASADKHM
jgi:Predicted membrane protein